MKTNDLETYLKNGYSIEQANQIIKADICIQPHLLMLSPNAPVEVFRDLRLNYVKYSNKRIWEIIDKYSNIGISPSFLLDEFNNIGPSFNNIFSNAIILDIGGSTIDILN